MIGVDSRLIAVLVLVFFMDFSAVRVSLRHEAFAAEHFLLSSCREAFQFQ